MMNSKDGYQRLQKDDEEIDNSVISSTEKSSVISTGEAVGIELQNQTIFDSNELKREETRDCTTTNQGIKLKIILKEKSYEISLAEGATISRLKQTIADKTDIPASRQRLIYSGKLLKHDEKQLSDYKIFNNSLIHLFPMPAAPLSIPLSSEEAKVEPANPQLTNFTISPFFTQNNAAANANQVPQQNDPIHFDPEIEQISREVKFWSVILVFLSGFTLFNIFSYVTTFGKFGNNWLQAVVVIIDTACSVAGLWVGRMGILSGSSLAVVDIQKYVKYLTILAFASIFMRILWVLSVVVAAQQDVNDYQKSHSNLPSSPPPTFVSW